MRVSIVIVLFNSAEYIVPCIESLVASEHKDIELVMVDNGSTDGSARLARETSERVGLPCSISMLGRNRGFARANNFGFRACTGDIVLLLNPDTEVYPDTIGSLARQFEDPTVGIGGCKVFYPDRETLQHAGGYIRDNALTMHFGVGEKDDGSYEELRDVAYVTGAALAIRRDLLERFGGLDPGFYPAYFEEADLCVNTMRSGSRVVYLPGARIVHHESTTTGKFTSRYYYLYHRNRIRFLLKDFSWSFLLGRALPMEREWMGLIKPWEQAVPLIMAYLLNIVGLPRTLLARRRVEKVVAEPRLDFTYSSLSGLPPEYALGEVERSAEEKAASASVLSPVNPRPGQL